MVSLVPSENRLVRTVNANQFVPTKFVEYSGLTDQVLVPVERKTRFVPVERLRIRTVGGGGVAGGVGGGTVTMLPPKPCIEQMYV
jgi:hypothetical protein